MKTILILRHAKSSWDDPALSDHARPLNGRGAKDAPRMGRLIAQQGLLPDLILSSTARRAQETAQAVAQAASYAGPLETRPAFYQAEAQTWLDALCELDESVTRVLLVGHNPTLEELAQALTGEFVTLPTAGLLHIEVAVERWKALPDAPQGRLVHFWKPKEI